MRDFPEDLRHRYDEIQMDLEVQRIQIERSSIGAPGFDKDLDFSDASHLEPNASSY
jgi:hypothetical protein